MRPSVLGLLATLILSFDATQALAISLDEFLGEGVVTSSVPNVTKSTVTVDASAVGGRRTLYAKKTSLGSGVTRLETFADPESEGDPDFSLGYTQGVHSGIGTVIWDGEDNAEILTPNGLGSIDLTQDDGTALLLGLKFFDFPSSNPLDLTLRFYDSNEPTADGYSEVTISLNQAIGSLTPTYFSVPLAAFISSGAISITTSAGTVFPATVEVGSVGPVDIQSVGAIRLTINGIGNTNAPDLTLDNLRTNGRCDIVPNSEGKVVDECGVCLNDPNANLGKDQCGVCLAGPPGYSYEQSKLFDGCGLCPSEQGYSFPGGSKDQCGVCNGDGKSCLDCSGVAFGSSKLDACGTCGGSALDVASCGSSCSVVSATAEVLDFEKRLLKQAKTLRTRFQADVRRAKNNKCKINLKPLSSSMTTSYELIRTSGREIFQQGIEVCSDSCITVSYAEQVQSLSPEFVTLETGAKRLAKLVQKCYRRIGKKGAVGGPGITSTIVTVRTGINQLVEDCRNRQVCPN